MSQSDEDLIRELEYHFNAAWDRHEGLAEALTDDAHFITVNAALDHVPPRAPRPDAAAAGRSSTRKVA
jgi:hypothetical protein